MSKLRNFLILGGFILATFALASWVRGRVESPPTTDALVEGILITDHYQLTGTLDQSLVVAADTAALAESARVFGDATLVGRSGVTVDGQVQGDLTAMGETFMLSSGAHVGGALSFMGHSATVNGTVEGDLTLVAEQIMLGPQAHISGRIAACGGQVDDQRVDVAALPPCSQSDLMPRFEALQSLAQVGAGGFSSGGALASFSSAFVLAGLTALLAAAFPRRVRLAMEAVRAAPGYLTGAGCLTLFGLAGFGLLALLVLAFVPPLGLILLLAAAALFVLLVAALVMGWVVLAAAVGDWIARKFGAQTVPPLMTAALGSMTLTLALNGLVFLPFGGLVALVSGVLLGLIGVGAVYRTRMGGRRLDEAHLEIGAALTPNPSPNR